MNEKTNETKTPKQSPSPGAPFDVDPKLLRMLVCPFTKGPLIHDRERNELVSKAGHVAFPIRDGIPLLTREAARPLEND